jgi:uncharacterized membrane protein YfcA
MDEVLLRLAVFAAVGIASGFVAGLFSIGGGIIRIPVFIHLLPLFGIPHPILMHVSLTTSLALVVPSSIASIRKHAAAGNLDVAYLPTWALGLCVGVLIGAVLLPFTSTVVLKIIFIVFLLGTAIYMAFFDDPAAVAHGPVQPLQGTAKLGVAAAIGCLSQLTGTGAGWRPPRR